MRHPAILLSLALLAACGRPELRPGGNLLIVVLDDVGIDQIAAYGVGADPPHTPVFDGLAADGLRFDNAWGMPTCSPARAALLTGRGARKTGIGSVITVREGPRSRLPLREQTIAELLRAKAGYQTAAIGKWHLVSTRRLGHRGHPERQGFDRFTGTLGPTSAAPGMRGDYSQWLQITDRRLAVQTGYEPVVAIEAAIDAVQTLEPPWLVYVALNLAHTPLHAPPAELVHSPVDEDSSDPKKYRAMVEAADTLTGQLLAAIPAEALADTSVILTSDNGTPHHGIRPPLDRNAGKDTLHEGGLRVPLIVRSPLVAQPGSTSSALVGLVDLLPTLAELAGVRSGRDLDGISLLPLWTDPGGSAHATLLAESFTNNNRGPAHWDRSQQVIRDASHKWLVHADGRTELYRLDPTGLTETGPLTEGDQTEADRAHAASLRRALAAQTE